MKETNTSKMIDISSKKVIRREASAEGKIVLRKSTMNLIEKGEIEKGDPLQIASIAAIQAAKATSSSLMVCHQIPIESTSVEFEKGSDFLTARVTVISHSRTGVEMEALNAVGCALLNIWDVVKKYEKDDRGQYPMTRIEKIRVIEKIKG